MTGALLYKEFRETLPIAAVGLACLVFVALDAMEYSPIPYLLGGQIWGAIPFMSYNDSFAGNFRMTAGALALALGFWHSLGDFWGEAHLFLLHRPVTRRSIYITKLVVGLVAYLLCAAIPIILYACWAATPGTHASPFDWSMTLPVWGAWFAAATLYLGAFLAGLRPAAWIGTRLAPLAAAAGVLAIAELVGFLPGSLSIVLYPLLLIAADIGLIVAILFTAEARDFA
jgi:hypothetical protein